jgi:hypothetical protein
MSVEPARKALRDLMDIADPRILKTVREAAN